MKRGSTVDAVDPAKKSLRAGVRLSAGPEVRSAAPCPEPGINIVARTSAVDGRRRTAPRPRRLNFTQLHLFTIGKEVVRPRVGGDL